MIYLVIAIYYEEERYEIKVVEGVHKTLLGAATKLLKLVESRPYKEYWIVPKYLYD